MSLVRGKTTLVSKGYVNNDVITLNTLKEFLRIDATYAGVDNILTLYRDSAISQIEKILNTSIVNSDYKTLLYNFSNNETYNPYSVGFVVYKPYINSVESIKYIINGVQTTLDTSIYYVESNKQKACILLNEGKSFSAIDLVNNFDSKLGTVFVEYKSGLFATISDIESTLKEAIIEYVNSKYNGCEDDESLSILFDKIFQYKQLDDIEWYKFNI